MLNEFFSYADQVSNGDEVLVQVNDLTPAKVINIRSDLTLKCNHCNLLIVNYFTLLLFKNVLSYHYNL